MDGEKIKIAGIELKFFIPLVFITILGVYTDKLPSGMLGALPFMMIVGAIFDLIGSKTPIVKDYLGGGPIVVIFFSAYLVYKGLLPEKTIDIVKNFMTKEKFLDFYIASLIVGSILGMDRKLLLKATLGYLPIILGGVVVSILLTGIIGFISGYGFEKAVLFIAIPIMGGGMGAGAIPLSQIFAGAFHKTPTDLLAIMVPAVALGNAFAIILGGTLDKIGKIYPKLTGNGKLIKANENLIAHNEEINNIKYQELGIGLIISTVFFILGLILHTYIPIHNYAIMIIAVAIFKATNLLPQYYELCCAKWFNFIMKNFTLALLVGIGVAYTNLEAVISSFSFIYVVLVLSTVLGAILGTAIVAHFINFYIIESAITAGLCMANMGGTGDVAVLSAAKRMELMPFAQISSRIGGAFMLLLTSLIVSIL